MGKRIIKIDVLDTLKRLGKMKVTDFGKQENSFIKYLYEVVCPQKELLVNNEQL